MDPTPGRNQQVNRVELTVEIALLILVSVILSVIINLATNLRGNVFLWTSATVVALAAAGLVRKRHTGRFFPRSRRLAIGAAAVPLLALAGAATVDIIRPTPSVCTRHAPASAGVHTDPRTHITWPTLYDCPTRGNASVYAHPAFTTIVGTMNAERQIWVVCWRHAPGTGVWYYTQGDNWQTDQTLHAWGFLPGRALQAGTHPDPAIPPCPATVS